MAESKVGGNSPLAIRCYEVLYYKRTNKVHKSRGTSKADGILKVCAPPSCNVTLMDANQDDDESSSSEEEEEDIPPKRRKKKFKKPAKQKASKSGMISSGINRDIAKKAFSLPTGDGNMCHGLNVDDVVILSQYECQIINVLSSTSSDHNSTKMGTSSTAARAPFKPKSFQKRPVAHLQSRNLKKQQLPKPAVSVADATGLTYPPPRPPARTIGATNWLARRAPPRQPIQQNPSFDESEESSADEKENLNQNVNPPQFKSSLGKISSTIVRKVNPLLQNKSKRRKMLGSKAGTHQRPSGAIGGGGGGGGGGSKATLSFPGAVGNVVVPPSVRAALRPHQIEGVVFLWNCLTGVSPALAQAASETEHYYKGVEPPRGCILADEMGLGKTLMTISTLYALHRRQKDQRFIVVAPSSLVANWGKEFDKWLGKASQPKRVVIRKGGEEGLAALRAFVPIKPHFSEVLIISYDLFRMNASLLAQAKQIGCLVVDEGHRLKNTAGSLTLTALQSLNCDSRILITGTPIQNNLSEFHNVANFVCPGLLGDLTTFRRVYERPINASNNKNASWEQKNRGEAQSRALEKITSTFMLRRLQRDVLKSMLPPRTELLLFCRPSNAQCKEYRKIAGKSVDSSSGVNSGGTANALTALTSLRKLCSHPYLLDNKSTSSQLSRNDVSLSGKLLCLQGLLKSIRSCNPEDKVVIVSNFTSALSVIESMLQSHQWSFTRLDGTTQLSDRQALVDSFNRTTADQSFAFLLSSKAGGCGLNLVGANRLVMFDPDWNPATDMQAMARVYRQGQTKPCFIYRFFTAGTVEEVIYQRQFQKGNLATLTVDGKSKSRSAGFTKEELRDCFDLKEACDCDTKRKVGSRWPEYSGFDSLHDQGCYDEPLINTAEEQSSTLAFVHIVQENEDPKNKVKPVEEESEDDFVYSDDSSSSEVEFEFE